MVRPRKKPVLVLNADQWTPLHRKDFNEVITNIVNGKYLIKVAVKGEFIQGPPDPEGNRFQIPWPVAVYVNRYVYQDFESMAKNVDPVMASRMAILHRDQFTCQYCGEPAGTYDHIIPQSRGGKNTWLNLVAACQPCNGFKANRTPVEAEVELQALLSNPSVSEEKRASLPKSMKLIHEPFVPDHDPYRRDTKDIWQMLKTGEGIDMSKED